MQQQPSAAMTHLPTGLDLNSSTPTPSRSRPTLGFAEQGGLSGPYSAYRQDFLVDTDWPIRAPLPDGRQSPIIRK